MQITVSNTTPGPNPLAPIQNWQANTAYAAAAPASFVFYNGSSYACSQTHTSGATFDATKWQLVAQAAPVATNLDAQAGTDFTKMMTPATVVAAINYVLANATKTRPSGAGVLWNDNGTLKIS